MTWKKLAHSFVDVAGGETSEDEEVEDDEEGEDESAGYWVVKALRNQLFI